MSYINKKNILFTVLSPLFALVVSASPGQRAAAEELGVAEIVDQTNQVSYYQGKDGKAEVSMTIVDAQGGQRHRRFTILRRDAPPPENDNKEYQKDEYCGDQKFYIYFHEPADVKDMTYMVWKRHEVGKDDDRWLYLPDLDLLKRIAASDERTSFVGSHFFYEDVSGRNPNEDQHELAQTTDTYYVLKNTPKKPELVEFAYYKMWIHKASFIPVQTEYYNDQGNVYRKYTALNVETIQGYPSVTEAKMEDPQSGGHTTIRYDKIEYNKGIPADIFENYQRYLRNPPRQHIQ